MRIPLIAGNWKMNKNPEQTREFVSAVKSKLPQSGKVETVIGAPAVDLEALVESSADTQLKPAAENCYFEDAGAFTGENSPKVLSEMHIPYVIIGHSERREYFHETDEDVNKKAHQIFKNRMTPILCVGESLEIREKGETNKWVEDQVKAGIKGLTEDQVSRLVIAYEPIWAIGTGKTATSEQAEEVCAHIRKVVEKLYSEGVAEKMRVLYGGSVKPENIKELMGKKNIDGGLVGGASLEPESFLQLANYND
ncbi:triose-phosphate isomerase [Xylocopilactobacillus apicola]|uniref:Triosephosphate isomerase n=1 Tax=Xylocopilactobacillus apicola TaxID=2932184 RepID=A0AAU9DHY5_9LACO|nr:triose-phosphate isomerase [Xylocopilactobacillus apicola]BDR57931.1 triosephosphate isomerase [Xylocopilactobacillus apicola]